MMTQKDAWKMFSTIETHCLLTAASYSELKSNPNLNIVRNESNRYVHLKDNDKLYAHVTLNQLMNWFCDHDIFADTKNRCFPMCPVQTSIRDIHDSDYYYQQIVNLDGVVEDEIYQMFCKDTADKSYLFSAIVSDKFYEIVKTNLIRYAKLILENEVPGNWHLKVITHANKPFNLLNVFMTNSQVMQIVNLGYDLASILAQVNEKDNATKSHLRKLKKAELDKIMKQLMKPVYIWQSQNIRDVYRKQLVDLNDQDVTPVLNKLERMVQNIVNHAQQDGNADFCQWHNTSIDPLDLDNLLVYHVRTDEKFHYESFALNQLNMKERHAELQPLINKLLHQMNE